MEKKGEGTRCPEGGREELKVIVSADDYHYIPCYTRHLRNCQLLPLFSFFKFSDCHRVTLNYSRLGLID